MENKNNEIKPEEIKYASILQRAVAAVIDYIIIFVTFSIIDQLEIISLAWIRSDILELITLFVLMPLMMFSIYFIPLEGKIGNGQTIGKRIIGIKVISEDIISPSYRQTFIRTFTRTFDSFFLHIFGAIFISISDKNQRLGDRLAKTIVIETSKTRVPKESNMKTD